MTAITARLAKWWAWLLVAAGAVGGLVVVLVALLRKRERGGEAGLGMLEQAEKRWREASEREEAQLAIIKAKDAAAKQELREIKREPDFRTRMERMRELKERVMREKS